MKTESKALIIMTPLDIHRRPLFPPRIVATLPRDGKPHRVGDAWETKHLKEMPYFVEVKADGGKPIIQEIECAGPAHMRHLNSCFFYMFLTVLPRV